MARFFLAALPSTGLLVALALVIGLVLALVGLALLVFPQEKQRPRQSQRQPSQRWQQKPAPTFLPGRRIQGEEAKRPRQWLEVQRISALTPTQAPPSPAVSVSEAPASPTSPTEAQSTAPLSDGTLLALPPEAPSAPAPAETTDDEPTLTLPPPAPAAPDTDAQDAAARLRDAPPLPMADEAPASETPEASAAPALEEASAEAEPLLPPASPPALTAEDDEVTLDTLPLGPVPLAESEPSPAAAAPPDGAAEATEDAEAAFLPAPEEEPTFDALQAPAAPLSPAEGAPEKAAEPPVAAPIRKARLSNLTQGPGATAAAGATNPFMPNIGASATPPAASPSVVRRARLPDFPHPSARATEAARQPQAGGQAEPAAPELAASTPPAPPEAAASAAPGGAGPAEAQQPAAAGESGAKTSAFTSSAASVGLRIHCFGTVDILVNGRSFSPLDSRFHASRECELMAFLAYWSAAKRHAFVDRATILEALVPEELEDEEPDDGADDHDEPLENRRSPIGGWKYRLCRRLRREGIPDHTWLETRADGALRLRSQVQVDLIEFLQVSASLRMARDQQRKPGSAPLSSEQVLGWLHQLQALYRDRGEFAEQFQWREWTQEPRRRYRSLYLHSTFYAAGLLATLGERQLAIQLAEELLEADEVEAEAVFEALITWLSEEGQRADLLRWLNKYREWYAQAYQGQTLERARPEFLARVARVPPASL